MNKTFRLPVGALRKPIEAHALAFIHDLSAAKAWRITIEPDTHHRSNAQNRALHGVALKYLADETGNDPDDLKTFFLGEFTGWKIVDVFGQKRRVPNKRSSEMDTKEFAEFYEFIQRRAAECGFNVPSPGEF